MSESPEKTPERVPLQKGFSLFKRFWPELRRERKLAWAIFALLLLSVPVSVIPPFLVRSLIDGVMQRLQAGDAEVGEAELENLLHLGGLVIALTLGARLLGFLHHLLSIKLHARIRFRMMTRVQAHLMRLPLAFFHRHRTGYLMARVRDDVKALDGLMSDTLIGALVDLGKALLCLALLLTLDPGLALSGFLLVALIFGGVLLVSPALRRRSERTREADAESSAVLQESMTGIATIRTNAQEATERRRFSGSVKGWARASASHDVLGAVTGSLISLIGVTGGYVIIVIAAYRILAGTSTFGGLLAFFLILFQMTTATGSAMSLVPALQRGFASLQRLFGILDEEIETEGRTRPATSLRGEVILENVSLRYGEDVHALKNVSLHVRPGEVIALVGRSGAGKTSLVHLLPRLYVPSEGRILLDGVPLADVPLRWLRRRIGVVPQDVFLFHRTLRENIAYGRPEASDEEIRRAAEAANAHEFIEATAKGYETLVGERGIRLSGGQRQRIAIAREILRDPPLLILDEATSNLDSESEVLVQRAIERLMQGRTCFVIAHRLSTIRNADRVLVLDSGEVIEEGSPQELLERDSILRHLRDLQVLGGEHTIL